MSGQVFGLNQFKARNTAIKVDGVTKTQTDNNGVYYLTFDKIPGTYEIEAENELFYFEPISVHVDENLR